MANPSPEVWTHADWIQVALTAVTFIFGAIGAFFVCLQNRILHRQNEIMEKQNTYNEIVLKLQNQKEWEASVLSEVKNVLKRTSGQVGLIQQAAQKLRNKYPRDVKTIVRGYAELAADDSRFERVEKFLVKMREYRGEDWPEYP